jgi:hypothetical protein
LRCSIVIISVSASYVAWNYLLLGAKLCDIIGLASVVLLCWLYFSSRGLLSILISLFWAAAIYFWFPLDLAIGWRITIALMGFFLSVGIHMQAISSNYFRHSTQ